MPPLSAFGRLSVSQSSVPKRVATETEIPPLLVTEFPAFPRLAGANAAHLLARGSGATCKCFRLRCRSPTPLQSCTSAPSRESRLRVRCGESPEPGGQPAGRLDSVALQFACAAATHRSLRGPRSRQHALPGAPADGPGRDRMTHRLSCAAGPTGTARSATSRKSDSGS